MRFRAMVLLFLILSAAGPAGVGAQEGWQLVIFTVNQNQQPVTGACAHLVQTVTGPTEEPLSIKSCDGDDGALDGSTTISNIPDDADLSLSIIEVFPACAEPAGIQNPDPTVDQLTIELHCRDDNTAGIDLAAHALRPSDLVGAGWTHDGAFFDDLTSVGANEATYRGANTTPAGVEQILAGYGWYRYYSLSMSRPSASDPSVPVQRVRSYITEYVDDVGAAAGFAYLEDEHFVSSAVDVPASRQFGDQFELTKDSGLSSVEGVDYRSLDLTFRSGNLVAGVTLIAYDRGAIAEPDAATVEALGSILEARLASRAPTPESLGNALNRLVTTFGVVATYDDAYYRWEGTDVPLTGESATAAANRIKTYADATDVYQLWQGVDAGTANGLLYGVTLLHFPTESSAADWVANLQTILEVNPFYANMRPVESLRTIGDQAIALSYAAGGGADTPRSMLIAVRVGSNVARVHVVPRGRLQDVPLSPVAAFAAMEAGCLSGNQCSAFWPVPDELTGHP